MLQTHPTPEQKKADQKAREKIMEGLKNAYSKEKGREIDRLQTIIGCVIIEGFVPNYSEDCLVRLIAKKFALPEDTVKKIIEESKKAYLNKE